MDIIFYQFIGNKYYFLYLIGDEPHIVSGRLKKDMKHFLINSSAKELKGENEIFLSQRAIEKTNEMMMFEE
jgi:hypothetical protein